VDQLSCRRGQVDSQRRDRLDDAADTEQQRDAGAGAGAGAGIVAPSDMMDGRIAAIRFALDRADRILTYHAVEAAGWVR
jgi:delta-aminolevulinic acid dehydratase/porphobilinogen synthase